MVSGHRGAAASAVAALVVGIAWAAALPGAACGGSASGGAAGSAGAAGAGAAAGSDAGGAGGAAGQSGAGTGGSPGGSGGDGGTAGSAGSGGAGGGSCVGPSDAGGPGPDGGWPPPLCAQDPPPGAPEPAPLPVYKGTCPALQPPPAENAITSSGAQRKFLFVAPKGLAPSEKPPVMFLWHWLGGSAKDFLDKGDIQKAADEARFLAVLPVAKGDLVFKWPFSIAQTDARMAEEYAFFDDVLACVAQAYPSIARHCVSTVGVSAGALFSDQLAAARANLIASFLSLSGGTGAGLVRPWGKPARKLPGVVLWGGPTDNCFGVVNFEAASKDLETALEADGHFMVECVHNCGHAEPPVDPPPGQSKYASLWRFAFDHPFWLKAGESPYKTGLPPHFPPWCAVGKGCAAPRTGPCPTPSGC